MVLSAEQRGILRIKNTFFMTMIQIREFAPKQIIIGLVIEAELLGGRRWRRLRTPPLKKAIPQLRGPLFSLKPLSE